MLKNYKNDDGGNIGMIFAIVIVPVLLAIGVGVDMSRISSYHAKLQDTSDAAALSAALAYMQGGDDEMVKQGKATFVTHASTLTEVSYSEPTIERTQNNSVKISSKGSFEPMFPQLFGYPKLDFDVSSEASTGDIEGLEISIAIDSTASMNFDSRWQNTMRVMENTLLEMQSLSGNDEFFLSLVPFSDRVNIGSLNARWLDGPAPSGWDGCVDPREKVEGDFNWALDDTRPRIEQFTPTDWDELGLWDTFQPRCSDVEITGPTKSVDQIITATNSLRPMGTGRFDVGLAWAWRTLSPNWRGEWRVPNYPSNSNGKRKKKIIFVSDGNADSSAWEMSEERDWGHNQGSISAFEHFTELCRKIKSDDIEIYVMNIDGNPYAKPYFEQCATSPNHYYLIDDRSNITLAFEDIRNELTTEVRIVR
jgi:hypothetical protein